MLKKISFFFSILSFIIILFTTPVLAEEYIFTTNTSFPVFYSSSIQTVNSDHNLYTAESLEEIQPLIDQGIVTYCEPMSYSELFEYTTNDTHYPDQINLPQISAPFAWNRGVFGDKVKIAVIDSGLYNAASDFNMSNIIRAKDYTATQTNSGNSYCLDEIGHGTMVTGIIAARHNTWGVAGIAPNVEIYVFKCFYLNEYGKQTAKNSDIIDALYSAIDDYDCDIINLSSGTTNTTVFKQASNYAEKKGVLLVSAAGNQGAQSGDTLYYPASYDNVIGVGSTKADGHRASHSQRNDYVDIMAPGENIYSARLSGYEPGSGTSYATPHVVAALALAKSLNPNLTYEELTDALYKTCNPMTDRYSGHGSLNIQGLLTYVKATMNKGTLVYSVSDGLSYAYLIPNADYRVYFAKYKEDCLYDIKEGGIRIPSEDSANFTYAHYIWKKNTLEPQEAAVETLEY